LSPTSLLPTGFNVSDSNSMAIGGLVVRNDVRSDVQAFINNASVRGNAGGTVGAGSVTVTAIEHAQISAVSDAAASASGGSAWGTGPTLAVNGTIATNLVQSQANAYIKGSDVKTTGDVALDAENISNIDAVILSATTSGDKAVGVTLAFNTIGWQSQNILF